MLQIALWEPEIPPNTGNIARLCAANDCMLHLVGRLGFHLDDRSLKRAGCDYWGHVRWMLHHKLSDFVQFCQQERTRIIGVETGCPRPYTAIRYRPGDCLLFGSESRGLPAEVLEQTDEQVHIPMSTSNVRSLNLATAAGIVLYEALRQLYDW
jgi:tRNA (cytidine/uridine-2'-O-)-methyltransferase